MGRRFPAALSLWLALAAGATAVQSPAATSNLALVAEYEGVIHPISAEFFDDVLTAAETRGAEVVVFVLRTPGGLLESTRTTVSRMIASRVPVVIFVGPSGARAASAGFILTVAADVAAMAPGTHIGAAAPVPAGGGQQQAEDSTMAEKAASDTAAYARTLAGGRKRNVELAAEAVLESRAFTDQEAITAEPPLIDLIAHDVNDLLAQLDGREVTRFNGTTVTLETSDLVIERMEMTRRQQLLSAIAHPQIAYLLMTIGMLGLVVELWNPGAVVPGVIGGISLLLAFFAFQVLPVNATGIALIVLGLGLLIGEVLVPSFGILGIGGIIALIAGAVMVTSEVPGLTVNYELIVPVALALAVIVIFLGRLAVKSQQGRAATGAEGIVGELGNALTDLGPELAGQVNVHGEIWRARSVKPIARGTQVRVTAIDGLTLAVDSSSEPLVPQGDAR